ncbi:MAG: isoprenylcysteine carboxylmethyltransferase family protein [Gammaproteobacteria bacterium]|nr:MAG: isoprenylcysteine carboxylmethyltransferase family protein [Gammaproteobacteria bacterium]
MIYVVIQFSCIIYLIINAQFDHLNTLGVSLIALSIVVGLAAVINMKPSNLNIVPTLKDKHQLITHGIYQFIRHPMYTSVLLFCLACALTINNNQTTIVMLILLIDLILKSNVEEKLLSERFDGYSSYKNKTGRFLPFL